MVRGLAESGYANSPAVLEAEFDAAEASYGAYDFGVVAPGPVDSWRYLLVKRLLDFFSSALLIALFAIPALVIAAIIHCTSEGPIFYREQRIGRYGRVFRIWKFRSMYRTAPEQAQIAGNHAGILEWRMRKHAGDPRITRIGGFLRRWSLDEIPQLINVLRGEMSLIGPRPIVEAETGFYGDLLCYYLAVTPGLSGLWQVSGRSEVGYAKRAQLDAIYVGAWSLWSDWAILLRTFPAVLGRRGAH